MSLSYSGFCKNDLYCELENNICKANKHNIDALENACCIATELICSKNETSKFLLYCLQLYFKKISHHHLDKLQQFKYNLEILLNDTRTNTKKIIDNDYQKTVSVLVILLCLCEKNDKENLDNSKNEYQIHIITQVEELCYNDTIYNKYQPFFHGCQTCVTDIVFRKLCVLLHALKNQKHHIISCLFYDLFNSPNRLQCQVQNFNWISMSKHLPLCAQQDIIWIIWKGLLAYSKKRDYYTFVKLSFNISLFGNITSMKQKERMNKAEHLLKTFLSISLCKVSYDKLDIREKEILQNGMNNIGFTFHDLFASKKKTEHMDDEIKSNHSKKTKRKYKNKNKNKNNTIKKDKEGVDDNYYSEKFNYLRVLPMKDVC